MKVSNLNPIATASALALIVLLPNEPTLAADGCPAPSFAVVRGFEADVRAHAMVVRDFNGDGQPDLVVADYLYDIVWMLLGNGDGTFRTAVMYTVGTLGRSPASLAVADFNGDGKLDLAVACSGIYDASSGFNTNGGVLLLLGNGDGTFQTPLKCAAAPDPYYSLVAGDFNSDGKADLAVVRFPNPPSMQSNVPDSVVVFLGNGDCTFRAPVSYRAGNNALLIKLGDFNRDSQPDLAVAYIGTFDARSSSYTNGGASILLNNGDGTFGPAANYSPGSISASSGSLTLGDFDNDGTTDLAVAGDGVSVWLGHGDGTFLLAASYGTGRRRTAVVAGDFNGDGKPDLALSEWGLSVLLGRGDGTFQDPLDFQEGGNSMAVGDFNGDGKSDLALGDQGKGILYVLVGKADGSLQTTMTYGGGGGPLVAADFNGDGKPDVAMAELESGNLLVLLGNGDGTFRASYRYDTDAAFLFLAAGDFNGDHKPDLAVATIGRYDLISRTYTNSMLMVLLGHGDGTFHSGAAYSLTNYPQFELVGDFNGDGKLDLLVGNSIWLGDGDGTFRTPVSFTLASRSVAVGDFNGDGLLDLAGGYNTNSYGGVMEGWAMLGNGDGTFRGQSVSSKQAIPSTVAVDFNGDGKLDLAAISDVYCDWCNGLFLWVLLGNGDGTFQTAGSYPAPGRFAVLAGDFNGDGKADLAGAGGAILLGNGDGTFRVSFAYNVEGNYAAVADFNEDGKPDIVTANIHLGTVSVLLNTCPFAGVPLGFARGDTTLTLTWPLPYTNFVLESTTSLGSPNWQRVPESLTTINGRCEVTVPLGQGQCYFRLRKP